MQNLVQKQAQVRQANNLDTTSPQTTKLKQISSSSMN